MNKQNTKICNSIRGEISVDLAGEAVVLVPSFKNLVQIESETELGLVEMASLLQNNKLNLEAIALIISIASKSSLNVSSVEGLIEKAGLAKAYSVVAMFLASIITAE